MFPNPGRKHTVNLCDTKHVSMNETLNMDENLTMVQNPGRTHCNFV
jgi:hypothetical protein